MKGAATLESCSWSKPRERSARYNWTRCHNDPSLPYNNLFSNFSAWRFVSKSYSYHHVSSLMITLSEKLVLVPNFHTFGCTLPHTVPSDHPSEIWTPVSGTLSSCSTFVLWCDKLTFHLNSVYRPLLTQKIRSVSQFKISQTFDILSSLRVYLCIACAAQKPSHGT